MNPANIVETDGRKYLLRPEYTAELYSGGPILWTNPHTEHPKPGQWIWSRDGEPIYAEDGATFEASLHRFATESLSWAALGDESNHSPFMAL